jgi:hypothetical protein
MIRRRIPAFASLDFSFGYLPSLCRIEIARNSDRRKAELFSPEQSWLTFGRLVDSCDAPCGAGRGSRHLEDARSIEQGRALVEWRCQS